VRIVCLPDLRRRCPSPEETVLGADVSPHPTTPRPPEANHAKPSRQCREPVRLILRSVLAALTLNGCSFIFVHGPPATHRQALPFECTSSNAPPIIDTVFSVTTPLGFGLSYLNDPSQRTGANIAAASVWTGALIASAIYGYHTTAVCRQAQAELRTRQVSDLVVTDSDEPAEGESISHLTKYQERRSRAEAGGP
jgi:hypothetical protein